MLLYSIGTRCPGTTWFAFGKWNEIQQISEPVDSLKYIKSVWHYARGMAYIRTGKMNEAKRELMSLKKLVADPFMENTIGGFNSFRKRFEYLGRIFWKVKLKAKQKNYDKSIQLLTKAVEIEDNLLYQEPPDWYHPARQILGGVLLDAKKPTLAELRFREDLNQYRNNGWSLFGLHLSLLAQGKKKEAMEAKKEFDKAFAKADITLKSVRY
ncbi:MAG: hypothetical protein U5K54_14520 [Cytophagales bacterium]|nr:hypothetical protein [Cytophagales bacterium]